MDPVIERPALSSLSLASLVQQLATVFQQFGHAINRVLRGPIYPLTENEEVEDITEVNDEYEYGDLRRLGGSDLEILSAADLSEAFANTLITAGKVLPWDNNLELEDITLTVGSGGHFATLNAALTPLLASTKQEPLTVHLLTGFVMAEQVRLFAQDLSFVKITAADAEVTVNRSALTELVGSRRPVFGAADSARLPRILALFTVDTTGSATGDQDGVYIYNDSDAIIGQVVPTTILAGVKNAPERGLHVATGSRCAAENTVWDGAGDHCARISNGSIATLRDASLQNAANSGLAANSALVEAQGADCSGAGGAALNVDCAMVQFQNGTATGADIGISATGVAIVDATGADVSGCTTYGINASHGGKVDATNANAQKGGAPAGSDITVETGGIINASGATGGLSQAANTVAAAGIIFQ